MAARNSGANDRSGPTDMQSIKAGDALLVHSDRGGSPTAVANPIPPIQQTAEKLSAAMERLCNSNSPPTSTSGRSPSPPQAGKGGGARTPSPTASVTSIARQQILVDAEDGDILGVLTQTAEIVESSGELDLSSADELKSKKLGNPGSVYSEPLWPVTTPLEVPITRARSLNSRNLRTISRPVRADDLVPVTFDPVLPADALGIFNTPRRTPLVRNTGTLAPHGSFTSRRVAHPPVKHSNIDDTPNVTETRSEGGPRSSPHTKTRPPLSSSSSACSAGASATSLGSRARGSMGLEAVVDVDDGEESRAEADAADARSFDDSSVDVEGGTSASGTGTSASTSADADIEDEGLLRDLSDDTRSEITASHRTQTTTSQPPASSAASSSSAHPSVSLSARSSGGSSSSRPSLSSLRAKGKYTARRKNEVQDMVLPTVTPRNGKDYTPLSVGDEEALQHAAARGDQLAAYHLKERGSTRQKQKPRGPQQQPQIVTGTQEPSRRRRTLPQGDHLAAPGHSRRPTIDRKAHSHGASSPLNKPPRPAQSSFSAE